MDESRILPDVRIFNSLIAVCARSASHGHAALPDGEALLGEMRGRGLRADVYTFNGLLDLCVRDRTLRGGRLAAARELVARMEGGGVEGDAATANLMLQCARADGESGEAVAIFEAMGAGAGGRDTRSYAIMISMAGGAEEALELVERAVGEGVGANAHMFNAALEVGLCTGGAQGYTAVRREMREHGVFANAVTLRMDKRAEQAAAKGGFGGAGCELPAWEDGVR